MSAVSDASEVRDLRARLEQAEHEVEALENQHDQLTALREAITQLADEMAAKDPATNLAGVETWADCLRALIPKPDTGGTDE